MNIIAALVVAGIVQAYSDDLPLPVYLAGLTGAGLLLVGGFR